jgi:hypothetical protein
MNRLIWVMLLAFIAATSGYSLSNDDIRAIMDKKAAAVSDAAFMIAALDNPDIQKDAVDMKTNPRLASLKTDENLTAGSFSVLAIEMKKVQGGLFYNITGFWKYAAESLVYQQILPAGYSWNRELSGEELIEFVTAIKNKSSKK